MRDETLIDVDGQLFERSEAISLMEKHWDKLPQDIQNELLVYGIKKRRVISRIEPK